MKVCETLVQCREILIASSKGDGTYYHVTSPTIFNDALCECPGYMFRQSCKHVEAVNLSLCDWFDVDPNSDVEFCPNCGAAAVDFTPEPEYDR
jgi:hypothetical protein